jgi:eukaryotic-like serine/threonine-protein kinase
MPPRPLEPGDPARLGRFELIARLGEGGQGVVYLGRGTGPGEERVAVKVLRSSSVDGTVLERLGRELDAIHQVQPFVTARVIEASAEGNRRFVVSEFIDGPSLAERVDIKGPLPAGDLHRLAVGTATALTAIHGAGVVHRDFKPANVLLGPDGPRVVDFGIARLIDAATITSGLIGTPSYVAPEQLAGARPTSAVDVFAWAVTMIFAATGRTAFGADAVPAVMHRILYEEPDLTGVPPALLPVILQCLDKDPGRRPSARDILLRLVDPSAQQPNATRAGAEPGAPAALLADSVPAHMPTHTPTYVPTYASTPAPQSTGPTGPAPSRRGPVIAACAAIVAAALIIGGVLLLTHRSPPSNAATGNTPGTGTTPATINTASTGSPSTQTQGGTAARIPPEFAGTWTGTATMTASSGGGVALQSSITFTFVAGATTIHETNEDCVNTLTLTKRTPAVLTFNEPPVPGHCQAGTVTFSRHGAGLSYRWLDIAGQAQNTAILRKA